MKKETLKIFVIVVLAILLVVFSVLLVNKNKGREEQKLVVEDSKLTEDQIYQEVLTEVLYGEEKYITHDENGNRVNTSDKMKAAVQVDGENALEVQGIEISSKDNKTIIEGTIKNNGTTTLGDQIYKISLKDDTGVEILEVGIYVDEVIPGETIPFQTYATIDLANAYSYTASK